MACGPRIVWITSPHRSCTAASNRPIEGIRIHYQCATSQHFCNSATPCHSTAASATPACLSLLRMTYRTPSSGILPSTPFACKWLCAWHRLPSPAAPELETQRSTPLPPLAPAVIVIRRVQRPQPDVTNHCYKLEPHRTQHLSPHQLAQLVLIEVKILPLPSTRRE